MNRGSKENSIKKIKDILNGNQMLILLNYKGLSAQGITKLRMNLKDKKANVRIFKNTLFSKAIDGTKYTFLKDSLVDQIAISFSDDPISLCNVLNSFAKENEKIEIKLVSMNGEKVSISLVQEMASLGSLEDIRAKFIGVLKAPGSQLVGVLEAYNKKLEA